MISVAAQPAPGTTFPMHGVAVDAGSGLAKLLREARGELARDDDLATFKRSVVRALSPLATTLLVDAEIGPGLLSDFASSCQPMLAYEADVYRISDADRITVLPDHLQVADYVRLGVQHLKLFMYYAPRGDAGVNRRKQEVVERVGAECDRLGLCFLFEPLVYDDTVRAGTADYASLKPTLVRDATATFADPKYRVDVLKVEVPVDLSHIEDFGGRIFSRAEALAAFRQAAAAAGDIPLVYLSAGVPFEQFLAALRLAREAHVAYAGFMCGRAIWSDAVAVYGRGGEPELMAWLNETGASRLQALISAASGDH
jgi:tagatose 1,6-diphosphate aldolase